MKNGTISASRNAEEQRSTFRRSNDSRTEQTHLSSAWKEGEVVVAEEKEKEEKKGTDERKQDD
jgi:hypothetical protein